MKRAIIKETMNISAMIQKIKKGKYYCCVLSPKSDTDAKYIDKQLHILQQILYEKRKFNIKIEPAILVIKK